MLHEHEPSALEFIRRERNLSTAGLAGGSFPLVAALYVTECVEPNFRGAFGVFGNVMNVSGALFVNGVGSLVDWVTLTGILIIFPSNFSAKSDQACKS